MFRPDYCMFEWSEETRTFWFSQVGARMGGKEALVNNPQTLGSSAFQSGGDIRIICRQDMDPLAVSCVMGIKSQDQMHKSLTPRPVTLHSPKVGTRMGQGRAATDFDSGICA